MKILKFIIIICVFGFTNCISSQNINTLSGEEYSNIKVNGINIDDIINTKGDITKIDNLFGFSFLLKSNDEFIKTRELRNDIKGIYIYFEDDVLYTYKISNNQSNLTIKGITITIGDDISKLGIVEVNTIGEVQFKVSETSDYFIIKFNPTSKGITSIEYLSLD